MGYQCTACGHALDYLEPNCPTCGAIDSIAATARSAPRARRTATPRLRLSAVPEVPIRRARCAVAAFDEVTGGGSVVPSSALVYGPAGVGKTSIALRVAASLARELRGDALYLSAEMPAVLVAHTARRLGLDLDALVVLEDGALEPVESAIDDRTRVLVVDSVQTVRAEGRLGDHAALEVAARACELARTRGLVALLLSQVNKGGREMGHEQLRHLVDVVLELARGELGGLELVCRKNRYGRAPVSASIT